MHIGADEARTPFLSFGSAVVSDKRIASLCRILGTEKSTA
jgi:hypothetical protein